MASTTLTRTPSSVGNQKTWTLSAWVKNSYGGMFFCVDSHGATRSIQCDLYQGADYLEITQYASGSGAWSLKTNRLFRDRNAWYHIVLSVDTTQATSSDRVKIYINGVRETSFSVETYPSQNYDTGANSAVTHMIGNRPSSSIYFDGLMTHFHFIDGTAYDASAFGETDATTGIWKAKTEPSVTYGTNGFFLKFENSGSMGTDSSGNGNNLTVNGNLTQTVDTPSNVFCTMNPLDNYLQQATFTNGNTTVATATVPYCANTSTLGVSKGKWYFEWKIISMGSAKQHSVGMTGVQTTSASGGQPGGFANSFSYAMNTGNALANGSSTSIGSAANVNDIFGIAVDLDNNKFWVQTSSGFLNSGDPASGTNGITITSASSTPLGNYFVAYGDQNDVEGGYSVSFNFGNGYFGTTAVSSATSDESGLGIFEYTVPSGYYALCTKNINEQEYD